MVVVWFSAFVRDFCLPRVWVAEPWRRYHSVRNVSITIKLTISKTAHDTNSHIGHTSPLGIKCFKRLIQFQLFMGFVNAAKWFKNDGQIFGIQFDAKLFGCVSK